MSTEFINIPGIVSDDIASNYSYTEYNTYVTRKFSNDDDQSSLDFIKNVIYNLKYDTHYVFGSHSLDYVTHKFMYYYNRLNIYEFGRFCHIINNSIIHYELKTATYSPIQFDLGYLTKIIFSYIITLDNISSGKINHEYIGCIFRNLTRVVEHVKQNYNHGKHRPVFNIETSSYRWNLYTENLTVLDLNTDIIDAHHIINLFKKYEISINILCSEVDTYRILMNPNRLLGLHAIKFFPNIYFSNHNLLHIACSFYNTAEAYTDKSTLLGSIIILINLGYNPNKQDRYNKKPIDYIDDPDALVSLYLNIKKDIGYAQKLKAYFLLSKVKAKFNSLVNLLQ